MNEKQGWLLFALLLALLFVLVYFYNGSGIVSNEIDSARLALQADGYANVQYIDKNLSACGKKSRTGYEFEAHKNDVQARVVACPMPQGYFTLVIVVKGQ